MAASLPNPSFKSAIERLPNLTGATPNGNRSRWSKKISANANAPGGTKKQTNGRARQDALQRLAGTMGIYAIEVVPTGTLAASVGGAVQANINTNGGTPGVASVLATPNPPALVPVTWAGAGVKNLSASSTKSTGEASIVV